MRTEEPCEVQQAQVSAYTLVYHTPIGNFTSHLESLFPPR